MRRAFSAALMAGSIIAMVSACSDVGANSAYCNDLYGIVGYYHVKVIENGTTTDQVCGVDPRSGGILISIGDTLFKWNRFLSATCEFYGVWDSSERLAHGGTQWRTEHTYSRLQGCYDRFTLDYRWERTFDSGAPGDTIEVRLEAVKMTHVPSYAD